MIVMKRTDFIVSELIDQYNLNDGNKPWVIGFSGGKDSTVLLTLVWLALTTIKREQRVSLLKREVFVVCNDTLVENPIIMNYVDVVLKKIEVAALRFSMPVRVTKTMPRIEDSFFVNLIGKGYPAPNNSFRWCTERLKIKPTAKFVSDLVNDENNPHKEAIILVGTRKDESIMRAKSIEKHAIRGKRLTKHPLQKNVLVYSPIKDLSLDEVWFIINTFKSPWGADNKVLYNIYADASADDYECPTMVANKEHKSCGQSRFGCWTCTVVTKDKSITAQIDSGQEWLTPLRDLRNWIQAQRNLPENRSHFRRNGQKAATPHGGVVKITHRIEILRKVFEAQKLIHHMGHQVSLISTQELIAIQVTWYRDLCFTYKVADIYNEVFNEKLDMKEYDKVLEKEEQILLSACKQDNEQFYLIKKLLKLQKSKSLMARRRGFTEGIENIYEEFIANHEDKTSQT